MKRAGQSFCCHSRLAHEEKRTEKYTMKRNSAMATRPMDRRR